MLSVACCVFYSHCGNQASQRSISFGRQWSRTNIFEDLPKSFAALQNVHQMKEAVCHEWLGPVGSAADYPVFSKWALYGEVNKQNTSPNFLALVL